MGGSVEIGLAEKLTAKGNFGPSISWTQLDSLGMPKEEILRRWSVIALGLITLATGWTMEIVGKKSQGLSVTVLSEDKTCIVSFNDRSLNFYVTDSLKDSLKETISAKIDEGIEHFILDLDNVKIIDSCGVGLIIVANNVTASREAKLYLCNIKPFIIKIFDIMRISKHLSIFENEDEALAAVKAS